MPVQFGILLSAAYETTNPRAELEARFDQVRAARDLGFDAVVVGQHFVSPPFGFFQPIPLLASLAGVSGKMRLGIAVLLLPFAHPVATAEHLASLDIITGGRLIVGAGLGWRKDEIKAFGMERQEMLHRYLDTLDLLPRLWTEQKVTYHGRIYHLEDVEMPSKPLQKPHPPIWLAASSDPAIRRAGHRGATWLGSSHLPLPIVIRHAALYRQMLAEAGHPLPEVRPLMRNVFVDESHAAAVASASPFLDQYYHSFAEWGLFDDIIKSGRSRADSEDILSSMAVVGDPDACTAQLQRIIDETDTNFLLFKVQWPGLETAKVHRAFELLATRVMPNLRESSVAQSWGQ